MTLLKKLKTNNKSGFTIVELLIATSVFAIVLIVAQAMFVQIGHLFYRGVSITNTQAAADHIFQDINGNFQNAQTFQVGNYSASGGYDYYCIGNTRYTYHIDNMIDTDAAPVHTAGGNFGILKDTLKGTGNACATPCQESDPCVGGAALSNPVELLGDHMRVEKFLISQPVKTSNLFNVSIIIAYGDTNSLTYKDPADLSTVLCKGEEHNNFCAVSSINTAIYKGLHQF
jgi:prepilin-type N-terminal cleavage/methylation domain-containing protein